MRRRSRFHLDFLSWGGARAVVSWRGFPVALQVAGLAVVVWLAWNGFDVGREHSERELMTLRKTNLTTLVVWGLWWPGMIAVVLLAGRLWCTVCPLELVNRIGDAVARRVGWPRARLGRWMSAGWIIVALYLLVQVLAIGISLHRVPHLTAILLLTLLGLALATGLVFRDPRSFCRAFCPAAALLSVYGRYTPVQLEARDASVCDQCQGKDCVAGGNRWRFDGRSCPSLLKPYRRQASDGCVLCLQCAKICPHDNMGFGVARSEAPIRRKTLLEPFEAAFVMVVLGFVAQEATGEVKWLDGYFHAVPLALHSLAPRVALGWVEALWFLALFPLVVWGAAAGLAYLLGHRAGWRSLVLAAATGAAPVVAIAHLAKAIAKMSSWGGYLPLALHDPEGVSTFLRLTVERSVWEPGKLIALWLLGWIMLLVILVMGWSAWRWVKDVPMGSPAAARAGMVTCAAIYVAVFAAWVA